MSGFNDHRTIAVDVDGVIFDIITPFCKICNEEHGTNMSADEVTEWNFYEKHGIDDVIARRIFNRVQSTMKNMHLIDFRVTKSLLKLSYHFTQDIVTVRTEEQITPLRHALTSIGLVQGTHYRKIVPVTSKSIDIKASYDYDIYIDDNPHLVPAVRKKEKYLILYDQPWNEHIRENGHIKRATNWDEIYEIIQEWGGK